MRINEKRDGRWRAGRRGEVESDVVQVLSREALRWVAKSRDKDGEEKQRLVNDSASSISTQPEAARSEPTPGQPAKARGMSIDGVGAHINSVYEICDAEQYSEQETLTAEQIIALLGDATAPNRI